MIVGHHGNYFDDFTDHPWRLHGFSFTNSILKLMFQFYGLCIINIIVYYSLYQ